MFYLAEVEDHIRVEPRHFGLATKDAVAEQLQESYVKTMHKELGFVISVINVGEVGQGMIHISQTMEDFVSFSKTGNLQGKVTKRSLNVGDSCLARIVAISYKAGEPKIGLTMRQPGLGKLDWIDESKKKASALAKRIEKGEKSSNKKGGKKK